MWLCRVDSSRKERLYSVQICVCACDSSQVYCPYTYQMQAWNSFPLLLCSSRTVSLFPACQADDDDDDDDTRCKETGLSLRQQPMLLQTVKTVPCILSVKRCITVDAVLSHSTFILHFKKPWKQCSIMSACFVITELCERKRFHPLRDASCTQSVWYSGWMMCRGILLNQAHPAVHQLNLPVRRLKHCSSVVQVPADSCLLTLVMSDW